MILNVSEVEARALSDELASSEAPPLRAVKAKLDRALEPTLPEQIPGQTCLSDFLEDAA